MALLDTTRQLPQYYYHDHALSILDTVQTLYDHILNDVDIEYIMQLRTLSHNALCLYLRLVNRKPDSFPAASLHYDEINMGAASEELSGSGLIIIHTADESESYKIEKRGLWQWLLYLYFGSPEINMSRFAVHDLRIKQRSTLDPDQLTARYAQRSDAEASYSVACKLADYYQRRQKRDFSYVHYAAILLPWLALQQNTKFTQPAINQLCDSLGRRLERINACSHAYMVYYYSYSAMSLERRLRMLIKWKIHDTAQELLMQLEQHEDATLKQQDYCRRMRSKLALTNNAERKHIVGISDNIVITLPHPPVMPVELETLEHYHMQGWEGIHAENHPWRLMMALSLWDVLHDPQLGRFHNPLQYASDDLRSSRQFWEARKTFIEPQLDAISSNNQLQSLLSKQLDAHYQRPTPFTTWRENDPTLLEQLCHHLNYRQIIHVIRLMVRNVATHRCGFPDLFICQNNAYRFIEIKSPNDTLSHIQAFWLREFARIGMHASMQRVTW